MSYSHGKLAILPSEPAGAFNSADTAPSFRFMFSQVQADPNNRLPENDTVAVTEALMALGKSIVDQENDNPENDMGVPPVYTYLGQFIDHDITLAAALDEASSAHFDINPENTTPLTASNLQNILRNGRDPKLNLDSLYGPVNSGPAIPMSADGTKFVVGKATAIFGLPDTPNADLPRNNTGVPLIGDGRNDENLLVAQLHVAFLNFHNKIVDIIRQDPAIAPDIDTDGLTPDEILFEQARRLTEWHYQWIVLHDYLPTICRPDIVAAIASELDIQLGDEVMSLEFAGAAFRFGHSMVRNTYDHNEHFGKGGLISEQATFRQLFQFTGRGGSAVPELPTNWVIDWDRFINAEVQSARGIDTHLAIELGNMTNEDDNTNPPNIISLMRMLAQRNLLRGYKMSLPTGQAIANAVGVTPLTTGELSRDTETDTIMNSAGFFEATPLWYYILKEAEVQSDARRLGAVGSHILAKSFVGLLRSDPSSILKVGADWEPSQGVGVSTISQLVKFGG